MEDNSGELDGDAVHDRNAVLRRHREFEAVVGFAAGDGGGSAFVVIGDPGETTLRVLGKAP